MGEVADQGLVNNALALPETGWIKELHIDLFHSTIMFSVHETRQYKHYTIVFSGVASFYFTRGHGDLRFEDPEHEFEPGFWAISEWTSAGYYPNGVGVASVQAEPGSPESQWVGRYSINSNFAIEMLAGMFFVEASRVQVDDQVFEVGYPSDNLG
jgi:hypothetical protein